MGDAQVVVFPDKIVIKYDVQIQCPGTPADDPLPACLLLDPVEFGEQFPGGKKSAQFQATV